MSGTELSDIRDLCENGGKEDDAQDCRIPRIYSLLYGCRTCRQRNKFNTVSRARGRGREIPS